MRRVLSALLAVIFVLGMVVPAQAGPAPGPDFTEFGGSPERQHISHDPAGGPATDPAPLYLGRSMSQPIIVGETLYHLAATQSANYLWAVDISGAANPKWEFPRWAIRISDGEKPAASHPTYSAENNAIYFGTNAQAVFAYNLATGRYYSLPVGSDVVSAPLAFPNDTIVFGTRDGYVWAVQGLKDGSTRYAKQYLGGAVSGSPTRIGPDSFVIGTDGGGNQVVGFALDRGQLKRLWSWNAYDGVPASFAVKDGTIYFSDKHVGLYALDAATGKLKWYVRPDPFQQRTYFINNSPAVDDARVYFTVRASGQNGEGGSGHVVAVDRATGKVAWISNLPGKGNTAPMVWSQFGTVLVGDTKGWVSGFSTDTGAPKPFIVDSNRQDPTPTISLSSWPWQDPGAMPWAQDVGAGAEITIAKNLLVFGVNFNSNEGAIVNVDGRQEISHGALVIARLSPLVNLKLQGAQATPNQDQTATIKATATLDQGSEPVDTTLGWKWDGEEVWRDAGPLRLEPGKPVPVSVTVPAQAGTVLLKVNYGQDKPAFESTFADNTVSVPVKNTTLPNLELHLYYPIELLSNTRFPVYVEVKNQNLTKPVTVPIDFSCAELNYSERRMVTVKPGQVLRVTFNQFVGWWTGILHWSATVNADHTLKESTYADNHKEDPTRVVAPDPGDTKVHVWLVE